MNLFNYDYKIKTKLFYEIGISEFNLTNYHWTISFQKYDPIEFLENPLIALSSPYVTYEIENVSREIYIEDIELIEEILSPKIILEWNIKKGIRFWKTSEELIIDRISLVGGHNGSYKIYNGKTYWVTRQQRRN